MVVFSRLGASALGDVAAQHAFISHTDEKTTSGMNRRLQSTAHAQAKSAIQGAQMGVDLQLARISLGLKKLDAEITRVEERKYDKNAYVPNFSGWDNFIRGAKKWLMVLKMPQINVDLSDFQRSVEGTRNSIAD